jgi:hypothetical protein
MTAVEWRQARGATGLLRTFTDAEVIESSDVHVAQRLTALASEPDEAVALAVALVVRALRNGSVCLDVRSVEQQVGSRTCRGPTSTSGSGLFGRARLRDSRPWCGSMGICSISTGTGWKNSRCAAMCSR